MNEGQLLTLVELVRREDRALDAYRRRLTAGEPHDDELAALTAAVRATGAFLAVNPDADVVRAYDAIDNAPAPFDGHRAAQELAARAVNRAKEECKGC